MPAKKTSRAFRIDAFCRIKDNICANPSVKAPMVLEDLAAHRAVSKQRDGAIKIAAGQYAHYFETVMLAIEQFEVYLLTLNINELGHNDLIVLANQLEALHLALHKIKPMIDKMHPSDAELNINLTLCSTLQKHEEILKDKIELVNLNLNALVIAPAPAVEAPAATAPKITFNPENLDHFVHELQSNIANITHTLQAAKQETMIMELLNRMNVLLNGGFIQTTDKNKEIFRAVLNEMNTSLATVVSRLSNHPFSKLKKAFARTEHAVSLLCGYEAEVEIDVQSISIPAQEENAAVEPTKTETSEPIKHFTLQRRDEEIKLLEIIKKFNIQDIDSSNMTINVLEATIMDHITSLDNTATNSKTLHALYDYRRYLRNNYDNDITELYVNELYHQLHKAKYKSKQSASRGQHSLFSHSHTAVHSHESRDKSPVRFKY